MLTWQEFDDSLWLSSLASQQTLAQSGRVADAKAFVEARLVLDSRTKPALGQSHRQASYLC